MKNLKKLLTNFIYIYVAVVSIAVSCDSLNLDPQLPQIIEDNAEYYTFKPETILVDISNGEKDIFTPLAATPEVPNSKMLSTVQWTQNDYYKVAQFAHEYFWHENVSDWNLAFTDFSIRCAKVSEGPQFGIYQFEKKILVREQESLIEHTLYIDISNNTITFVEEEWCPSPKASSSIDTETKISIQDALEIAEEQGGKEIREDNSNNCKIRATLYGGSENWIISYVDTITIFEIYIDVTDGEYKVVKK